MQVQSGYAFVNGTRLYYETAGRGKPLILLHGFVLDCRLWDPQFELFARSYAVLRYDLRGFGKSEQPEAEFAHIDDLKALMAYRGIERATLCGLSLGARVAIDFALTYTTLCDALILVDAVISGFDWSEQSRAVDRAVFQRARAAGADEGKAAWLAHPLFEPTMANERARPLFETMVGDCPDANFVARSRERRTDPPAAGRLRTIHVPTLVIAGERDTPDFLRATDLLEREIPNAVKVIIRDAGHLPNLEAPEQFNPAVLDFLASLQTPTP